MSSAPVPRLSRALLAGVSLVALIGFALTGCAQGGGPTASATATTQPTATPKPTTCAQVQGFASAAPLSLPQTEFPAGTIAQAPTSAAGGTGQYTIKTYLACAPNTDTNLTVQTGKGPEPFTTLILFYGWAPWSRFPASGDAQVACAGTCFAFNADDPAKGLFQNAPGFLSLESVASVGNGLVTFTVRVTTPPTTPICDSGYDTFDDSVYGHHPEYQIYYDVASGVQFPPLTRLVGDSTPSAVGEAMCSAGTAATVRAFMDSQFSSHGYAAVACGTYDCWKSTARTVTMSFPSATQWTLSVPRF